MSIYADEFGSTIVQLGTGDVVIGFGYNAETKHPSELLLFEVEGTGEIGDDRPDLPQETTEILGAKCVRICIGRIGSLDVLIEQAQNLRALLCDLNPQKETQSND